MIKAVERSDDCLTQSITEHVIYAGDVMAMNTTVMPFVLLVMAKDDEPDPTYGAKVYFRWLAHPEADKITTCEWMWERSLRSMDVWQKVASAMCHDIVDSAFINADSTSNCSEMCMMAHHTRISDRTFLSLRCGVNKI